MVKEAFCLECGAPIPAYSTALYKDTGNDPDWAEKALDIVIAEKDLHQAGVLLREIGVTPDVLPEEQAGERGGRRACLWAGRGGNSGN